MPLKTALNAIQTINQSFSFNVSNPFKDKTHHLRFKRIAICQDRIQLKLTFVYLVNIQLKLCEFQKRSQLSMTLRKRPFENIVGKRRKCWLPAFSQNVFNFPKQISFIILFICLCHHSRYQLETWSTCSQSNGQAEKGR